MTFHSSTDQTAAEPLTVVVNARQQGDYATITEALKAVKAGTRILVRPGLYKEGIVIDKPVEIIGDGERDDIVIEAYDKHTVVFQADNGRLANLTLRQSGGDNWCGVNITQGRLELEHCDISSQSGTSVTIHGSADPYLCHNRIHDGKSAGILVCNNGQGLLDDNEIFANAEFGVLIMTDSNPILRRNCIHDGKKHGIVVIENGQGLLEDNEIFANADDGVAITTGGNPTLRRNRIHDGKKGGIFVDKNSQGLLEDNEIFANANDGVAIMTSNPTLRRNRIAKNGGWGIVVLSDGGGIFEGNDLLDNAKGAWGIAPGCEARMQRSGNIE